MVNVEQSPLRSFKQNALALAPLSVEQGPYRINVRQHARRHALQMLMHRVASHQRKPHPLPQRVVMRKEPVDLAPQRR